MPITPAESWDFHPGPLVDLQVTDQVTLLDQYNSYQVCR